MREIESGHQSLKNSRLTSWKPDFFKMLVSFFWLNFGALVVIWISIFYLAIKPMFAAFQFQKMDVTTKFEFECRLFAIFHSIITCTITIYTLVGNWGDLPILGWTLGGSISSFLIFSFYTTDFLLQMTHMKFLDFSKGGYRTSWQLYLHHFATICPFFINTYFCPDTNQNLLLYVSLCEINTPFTNLHWILSKVGLRNTIYFKINLLLSIISYFIIRFLLILWIIFKIFNSYSQICVFCNLAVVWATLVLLLLIFSLSVYWLHLMLGHLKTINQSKKI